jgi:hypothetical protein
VEYPLQGCLVKIEAAKRDLDSLERETREWIEADAYRLVVERDPTTREYVPRVQIPAAPKFEWGHSFGRAGNDLRSSLDHLVYQVAIASGSDPEQDRTQFPIFSAAQDYLHRGKKSGLSQRDRYLAGVDESHRKIIDSYQPYHRSNRPDRDPLAELAWLDDADKHRVVHASLLALGDFDVVFDPPGPGGFQRFSWKADRDSGPWVMKDGKELVRIGFTGLTWEPEAKLETKQPPEIAFGERKLRIGDLRRIGRHVEEIVGRFAPVLTPSP